MKTTNAALALLVGLAIAPSALLAQGHHTNGPGDAAAQAPGPDMARMMGMCGQSMMSGQGMMGGKSMMGGASMMGSQIPMLLGQKEALALSDEQVNQLEALSQSATAQREDHMAEMKRLDQDAMAVLTQEQQSNVRFEMRLMKGMKGMMQGMR